jgi:hypothetical protein
MLPIVSEVLEEGDFKSYIDGAIVRANSVDTVGEAIQWISDELRLPSLRALAIALVQGFHYENISLEERLLSMASKDREKVLINFDKVAESKRMKSLVEAGSFIVMPLIGLSVVLTFYYVYKQFLVTKLF